MRLSVIVVTTGRESLVSTLASLEAEGLGRDDEVIVISDGPSEAALNTVTAWKARLPILYHQGERAGDWGGAQRNRAQAIAQGSHLYFLDDDDVLLSGALGLFRAAVSERPDTVHIFRYLDRQGVVVPLSPYLWEGNISTQCVLVPNDPERLGAWSPRYEQDYDFIWDTLDNFRPVQPVWHRDLVAVDGNQAAARGYGLLFRSGKGVLS